jgi:hypothetical protein
MNEPISIDPKELAVIRTEYMEVEGIGKFAYGRLTVRDLAEIRKKEDEMEQSYMIVHRMLSRASPELTVEEIGDWDPHVFKAVFDKLIEVSDFRAQN